MQTTITLAKALKLKNRLVGRLSTVNEDITTYNSVLIEKKGDVDVAKLMERRINLVEALIGLKTAIHRANVGVQGVIYRLDETKSEVDFLRRISTRTGKERHDYQNTEVEYFAVFEKKAIDERVIDAEARIDALQDQLDEFNHSTKITVGSDIFDLLK